MKHFNRARNSQALITAGAGQSELRGFRHIIMAPLSMKNITSGTLEQHDENFIARALEISGGNTSFFLELLQNNRNNDAKRALKLVLERYHTIFYQFRRRFTDLQWKLLLAIACEGSVSHPHAFEFLINYRLGAASSVERALKNLSDTAIIRNNGDGWHVADIRFRRWLVQLYPQVQSLSQN